jgi:hypothetical protein
MGIHGIQPPKFFDNSAINHTDLTIEIMMPLYMPCGEEFQVCSILARESF